MEIGDVDPVGAVIGVVGLLVTVYLGFRDQRTRGVLRSWWQRKWVRNSTITVVTVVAVLSAVLVISALSTGDDPSNPAPTTSTAAVATSASPPPAPDPRYGFATRIDRMAFRVLSREWTQTSAGDVELWWNNSCPDGTTMYWVALRPTGEAARFSCNSWQYRKWAMVPAGTYHLEFWKDDDGRSLHGSGAMRASVPIIVHPKPVPTPPGSATPGHQDHAPTASPPASAGASASAFYFAGTPHCRQSIPLDESGTHHAKINPCISIDSNNQVIIWGDYTAEETGTFTVFVWLADAANANPVTSFYARCPVTFTYVGQQQTAPCKKTGITPPRSGKWIASMVVEPGTPQTPALWNTNYKGTQSGGVTWNG
jgi:hypothetical protein